MDIGISWDIMAANLAVTQPTRSNKMYCKFRKQRIGRWFKISNTLTISTAKTLKHVEAAWFIVKSAHDRKDRDIEIDADIDRDIEMAANTNRDRM